jgi:hypothetical protein
MLPKLIARALQLGMAPEPSAIFQSLACRLLARRVSDGDSHLRPQELAKYLPGILTIPYSSPFIIRDFNVADEIADDFNLIGIIVGNLHINERILDQYRQLKTIEPVGAEIVTEVRFICNASDIDTQIVGDQCAHSVAIKILLCR